MTPRQRKALDSLRDELARREGGYCTVPVTVLRAVLELLDFHEERDAAIWLVNAQEPAPQ